jgi:hypothetical protein
MLSVLLADQAAGVEQHPLQAVAAVLAQPIKDMQGVITFQAALALDVVEQVVVLIKSVLIQHLVSEAMAAMELQLQLLVHQ